MELIAWALYGLLLVGPYVATFIGVCLVVFFLLRSTVKRKTKVSYAMAGGILVGIGWPAYGYLLAEPSAFRAACASGIGIRIFKQVKANSYALTYPENSGGGYLNGTDATIEQAILNVAHEKLQFVEIQESKDSAFLYGDRDSVARYRDTHATTGYAKIFIMQRGSKNCRWLMPGDVAPLDYRTYILYGANHERNKLLFEKAQDKQCVAVGYVSSPSSPYLVEFAIAQLVQKNLLKHEIRVVNLAANRDVVGNVNRPGFRRGSEV